MTTISSSEQPQMQQIDLMKLNLQQLTQLKNQLDQVGMKCFFFYHLLLRMSKNKKKKLPRNFW